jgi:hypothetical protein
MICVSVSCCWLCFQAGVFPGFGLVQGPFELLGSAAEITPDLLAWNTSSLNSAVREVNQVRYICKSTGTTDT